MASHTIELDDADFKALEAAARAAGLTVRGFLKSLISRARGEGAEVAAGTRPSRWAQLSQRVQSDPPLRGAGEYVRECSRALREDFALTRDDLEQQ